MRAMKIQIPRGHQTLDGTIECTPDDKGNFLYIETDDGVFGEQLPNDHGDVVGARIRIEIVGV